VGEATPTTFATLGAANFNNCGRPLTAAAAQKKDHDEDCYGNPRSYCDELALCFANLIEGLTLKVSEFVLDVLTTDRNV